MVKQTAGRDALGTFAPKFAELNDDVLFGQVWSREEALSLRDRSVVTVTALMAQGLVDESFRYHLTSAKQNGVTGPEMAEILTHAAFYAGWPKAWAAFRMAKEVWGGPTGTEAMEAHRKDCRAGLPSGSPHCTGRLFALAEPHRLGPCLLCGSGQHRRGRSSARCMGEAAGRPAGRRAAQMCAETLQTGIKAKNIK